MNESNFGPVYRERFKTSFFWQVKHSLVHCMYARDTQQQGYIKHFFELIIMDRCGSSQQPCTQLLQTQSDNRYLNSQLLEHALLVNMGVEGG